MGVGCFVYFVSFENFVRRFAVFSSFVKKHFVSMSKLPVCRVCLACNRRMYNIANTRLQTIFEALSGNMLLTKDGKPETVCYICYARLRSCWKLQEMSQKAEQLLTQLLCKSIMVVEENLKMLNGIIQPMLTTKTLESATEYSNICVKEEITGFEELMPVKKPMGDHHLPEIPMQFDLSVETILLKQELNCSEFDDNIQNSCKAQDQNRETDTKVAEDITAGAETINKITKHTFRAKRYACDICSKLFKQAAYLQRHKKTHMPKPFSCPKCLESFSTKSDFQTHLLKHTQLNLHVCDLCSKAFLSKNSLENHVSHEHMRKHIGIKSHACDRCNKTFNHRGTLRLHMRIHTGDKPYACEHCSKTFSQKGTLRRHIRMHTGEKPYACDRCTKTFNQESSLKRHIKMHTGEKQYACNRCGKAYYESSHLTRHMRTHTGEKPYACDRCFQTFAQSSNLQAHMKKHTGEKASNYICHECNKTFDHKCIYKRHLLIHTREKPYPCDQCDKKYADKRTLQRHILIHKQNG